MTTQCARNVHGLAGAKTATRTGYSLGGRFGLLPYQPAPRTPCLALLRQCPRTTVQAGSLWHGRGTRLPAASQGPGGTRPTWLSHPCSAVAAVADALIGAEKGD